MVLIECKRLPKEEHSKDYDAFIVSFPGASNIGEVTDQVQIIQNKRVRLQWMISAAKQLVKDALKSGNDANITEENKHLLIGPAEDAERYLSLERTDKRLLCTLEEIDRLIDTLKGGAMAVFPAECSGTDAPQRLAKILESDTYEEVKRAFPTASTATSSNQAISDDEKSKAHRILSIIDDGASNETILEGKAIMWWSNRPLPRDGVLSQFIGKNEKTKINVKLCKEGSQAPPREPVVDAKAQAELMAHFYKKQEEMKKMIEDEDLSFANSEWANPSGLKSQLHGFGNIQYKPSL